MKGTILGAMMGIIIAAAIAEVLHTRQTNVETKPLTRAEVCRSIRYLEIRTFDEEIQDACFNALTDFRAQRTREFWEAWETAK